MTWLSILIYAKHVYDIRQKYKKNKTNFFIII
jgi:hypothetical protein